MFRPQATAEYVNANTRGALLAVVPPSSRWLLGTASFLLLAALALATIGRVRDSAEGRGEVQSSERPVAVVADAPIRIRAVRRAVGEAVKRGDVLFDIDTSGSEQVLADCERQIEGLTRGRQTAQQKLDLQILRSAPDDAITYLLEQRVERSKTLVEEQQRQCDKAAAAAKRVAITSPIDGTCARIHVQPGQFANEGAALAAVLPETAQSRGYVRVSESEIGRIQAGAPVYLRFDAYPYEKYGMVQGKVLRVLEAEDGEAGSSPRVERRGPEQDDSHRIVEVALVQQPEGVNVRGGLRFTASIVTGERSVASLAFAR